VIERATKQAWGDVGDFILQGLLVIWHNFLIFSYLVSPDFTPTPSNLKENTMASELIKHITDASFEQDVLQSELPVLVDYWAEWCGPCRMIAPVLDELAVTYKGQLQITKMNVDENQTVPAQFGIRGIPTLMIFKAGKLVKTQVGALSKGQMTALVAEHI
jgi:thioredoxin 1